IGFRFRNAFRAVAERAPFGGIDVAHGDEGEPRRLAALARRQSPLQQPGDRASIEQRHRIISIAGVNGLVRPAEQSRVEALSRSKIRGDEIRPNDFTGMMFRRYGTADRWKFVGRGECYAARQTGEQRENIKPQRDTRSIEINIHPNVLQKVKRREPPLDAALVSIGPSLAILPLT